MSHSIEDLIAIGQERLEEIRTALKAEESAREEQLRQEREAAWMSFRAVVERELPAVLLPYLKLEANTDTHLPTAIQRAYLAIPGLAPVDCVFANKRDDGYKLTQMVIPQFSQRINDDGEMVIGPNWKQASKVLMNNSLGIEGALAIAREEGSLYQKLEAEAEEHNARVAAEREAAAQARLEKLAEQKSSPSYAQVEAEYIEHVFADFAATSDCTGKDKAAIKIQASIAKSLAQLADWAISR